MLIFEILTTLAFTLSLPGVGLTYDVPVKYAVTIREIHTTCEEVGQFPLLMVISPIPVFRAAARP